MRKIYLLISVVLLVMASSCVEDKILTYDDANYVQFTKNIKDSTICSFLAFPDLTELRVPLSLELIGFPGQTDRKYRVEVVDSLTTSTAANFQVESEQTFRAGLVVDSCWITVKKTPGISTKPVRLVLRLVESGDFKVGQSEYSAAIVNISDLVSKPQWWNSNVTRYFLGDYSDKKYRLFIAVTGKTEIDVANEEELRYYTLLLKYHLLAEKEAGRTVYEDDGKEMTVAYLPG